MWLESLLQKERRIAVLAGAGVSLDSPSNLLDGWSFMFETLRRVCPPEIDDRLRRSSAELKRNNAWKKSWLLSILDLPNTPFHRPGEHLRFEVLMAELVQSGLDPELNVLNCLDQCDKPNRNHFILAQLLRSHHIVVTTNFDRLIELAYARLAAKDDPPLRVVCMDDDFPETVPSVADQPTLWKLHGSISVNGEDTRRSIQATMMSILATTMTARKRRFLKRVLADFDLFVVGYSGWDDLDIIPTLANSPSEQRLIWIDHNSEVTEPVVKDAATLNEQARAQWEIDSVGRDRIRFTTDPDGGTIRDPQKVLTIATATSQMMDAFCEVYFAGCSFDTGNEQFKFGREFPDEVQRYFDRWQASLVHGRSAPYMFVANLFSNRANARKDVQQRLQTVHTTLEKLQAAENATPPEKLRHLIDSFNRDHDDPGTVDKLQKRLVALMPLLPAELEGTAMRLLACIVWVAEGELAGTEVFRKAVNIDRNAGRFKEEFSTLTTWRSFTGYSQWSDLFAENESEEIREQVSEAYLNQIRLEAAEVARLSGVLEFPEEETRRIHELAGKIGFFPILWSQAVASIYDAIDDDPRVLLVLHDRIRRIKRFCVDLGDVLGEAQTTQISGRMYSIDKQYQIAIEELLRVEELHRILGETGLMLDTKLNLKYCTDQIGTAYLTQIKPHLQKSMWGHAVS